LIAIPVNKLSPQTAQMESLSDVPQNLLDQIKHFFEQYKALEKGKWVKVEGWGDIADAHKEIMDGIANAAQ
jgi:inorganic pyrophosphatase